MEQKTEESLLTLSGRIYQRMIYTAHNTEAECFEAGKKIQLEHNKDQLAKLLDTEIALIDNDERFHYEPAQVQINAPLALIQVGLEAKMALLKGLKLALAGAPTGGGYTNPGLLKKAKTRCKHCHALRKENEVLRCDKGDCDITAVLVCKAWGNEKIGRID